MKCVCVCVCVCACVREKCGRVTPEDSGPACLILKMKAQRPFEKSAHRNAPEYLNLQQHSCEILKSLMLLFLTSLCFADTMTAFCTTHSIYWTRN